MIYLIEFILFLLIFSLGCKFDKAVFNGIILDKNHQFGNINLNSTFESNFKKLSGEIMENGTTDDQLAYYWAPVHYQAVEEVQGDGARPDFITRIDRDLPGKIGGLWDLRKNWDKNLSYPLRAYVYYSVVKTESHFFITYSFYHPWDTEVWSLEKISKMFQLAAGKITEELYEITNENQYAFFLKPIYKKTINKLYSLINFLSNNLYLSTVINWFGNSLLLNSGFNIFVLITYDLNMNDIINVRTNWDKNDMEGLLFVIKRNQNYGSLDCVFSQGHGYLHTYFPKKLNDYLFINGVGSKRRRPFPLQFIDIGDGIPRVKTSQEAGGHGAGCLPDWGAPSPGWPDYNNYTSGKYRPGTGKYIIYYPGTGPAEEPDINNKKICRYNLINLFDQEYGLWTQRCNLKIFEGCSGSFIGEHSGPPWTWRGNKEASNENDKPWLLRIIDDWIKSYTGTSLSERLNNSSGKLYLSHAEENTVLRNKQPWTHLPTNLCKAYIRNINNNNINPSFYFSNLYTNNRFLDSLPMTASLNKAF